MKQMTFTKACSEFFGRDRGAQKQNLTEFMAEIKALTPADRDYFKREFVKVGIEITEA